MQNYIYSVFLDKSYLWLQTETEEKYESGVNRVISGWWVCRQLVCSLTFPCSLNEHGLFLSRKKATHFIFKQHGKYTEAYQHVSGIFFGKYGYSKYRSTTFQDFLIGNSKKLQYKLFSGQMWM